MSTAERLPRKIIAEEAQRRGRARRPTGSRARESATMIFRPIFQVERAEDDRGNLQVHERHEQEQKDRRNAVVERVLRNLEPAGDELPNGVFDVRRLEARGELFERFEAARAGGAETFLRRAREWEASSPCARSKAHTPASLENTIAKMAASGAKRGQPPRVHDEIAHLATTASGATSSGYASRTTPRGRRARRRRRPRNTRARAYRPTRREAHGRPSDSPLARTARDRDRARRKSKKQIAAETDAGTIVQSTIDSFLKLSGNVAPAATENAWKAFSGRLSELVVETAEEDARADADRERGMRAALVVAEGDPAHGRDRRRRRERDELRPRRDPSVRDERERRPDEQDEARLALARKRGWLRRGRRRRRGDRRRTEQRRSTARATARRGRR